MQKVRQVRRHYSATAEGLAAEGGRAEGKGRAGRGPSQGPAGALASGNPTGSTGAIWGRKGRRHGSAGSRGGNALEGCPEGREDAHEARNRDAGPVRTMVKRIRAGARPVMPGARGKEARGQHGAASGKLSDANSPKNRMAPAS